MPEHFQIAIDGPVAAGKGTVSKKLAERLGFLYVDTGATYRVGALLAQRNGFDFEALDREESESVSRLVELVRDSEIGMRLPQEGERDGRLITVLVNGEDVSWAIREREISKRVPIVAKIAELREVLVEKQQEIAGKTDVVMEGRDITYRVLPDAQLKIYLDASEEERIQRRIAQLHTQGVTVDEEKVAEEIKARDKMDMNREADPLKIVEGAWHFDASGLSITDTVDRVVKRVEEIRGE